jgi:hypothetical protein
MSISKTEVFDRITTKGFIFENPTTDTDDTSTAGKYPSQNSVLTIIDSVGTADFSRVINTDSVTLSSQLTATNGTFTTLNAGTGTFNQLTVTSPFTVSNATVIGDATTGNIQAGRIQLVDPVTSSTARLDVSGTTLLFTDSSNNQIDVLGWSSKLAQNTTIALLNPLIATDSDIANTLNALLNVFRSQGVFIS